MRGGRDGHEERRKGAERRRYAEKVGTRLTVEGDVVMADTDKNPERRAQGQRRGREGMERRSTGAQTGADETPRQRDAGRVVGTASSGGQKEKPGVMQ